MGERGCVGPSDVLGRYATLLAKKRVENRSCPRQRCPVPRWPSATPTAFPRSRKLHEQARDLFPQRRHARSAPPGAVPGVHRSRAGRPQVGRGRPRTDRLLVGPRRAFCWATAIRPWSRRCSGRWRGRRIPAPATKARSNGASGCSGWCRRPSGMRFVVVGHRGDADGPAAGAASSPAGRASSSSPAISTAGTISSSPAPTLPHDGSRARHSRRGGRRYRSSFRPTISTLSSGPCATIRRSAASSSNRPAAIGDGAGPRAVPQGTARDHGAARTLADFRRGHHRLPRLAGRRAGALRHHAGPDDAGEDPGRRSAGRLRGRPGRHPGGIWSSGRASRR